MIDCCLGNHIHRKIPLQYAPFSILNRAKPSVLSAGVEMNMARKPGASLSRKRAHRVSD